jgi:polysaccharide biosynthesis protein PslG
MVVASPALSRCKPHRCSRTTTATTVTSTTGGTTTAPATTTTVSTTTATTTSSPPSGRFGVDDGGNLETLTSSVLAQYLDGVKASGATWLRVGLYWCSVMQGGPTSYNWAPFDRIVDQARLRGINILGVLIYTPAWARPSGTTASYPPTDLHDYASYVHVAAAHFAAHGVHSYEIWNEPNLASFWAPAPDPARYTQLLKLAYPAIKSSDPSATVVTGGLSPGGTYGTVTSTYTNPVTFLEQMYKDGARGYFDAVGWHPYSYPYGLGYYTWSAWSQMSQTNPSARSIMAAYGDSAKQIWPTEMGAPTGTSSQAVTEAAQAQLVIDMYAKLKTWSWTGPSFVYNFRDKGTDSSNREDNFGIVRWDWSPKPAYAAFKTAVSVG